jgi:hypothetical protein
MMIKARNTMSVRFAVLLLAIVAAASALEASFVGSMRVAYDFDANGRFIDTKLGPVRARR